MIDSTLTAVISHDAGGAEILSSYVRQQNINCCYVLEGPASKIFERKLGINENIPLKEAIHRSTSVICGTSWQSDIEFEAIKMARSLGKRSVAFIDHWVNYADRFVRLGETVLPDEIWVGDAWAKAMVTEIFPSTPVLLLDNPYLQDVRVELLGYQKRSPVTLESISVLYVCEPIGAHALLRHGDARFWGYVEEDALHYFLSNLSVLGKPVERILIRPHPSELVDKYSWVQKAYKLPIQFAGKSSLLNEISDSDVVVGCESMAMVIALLADKKVMSCIPPQGRACALPYHQIASLQNMLSTRRTVYENN